MSGQPLRGKLVFAVAVWLLASAVASAATLRTPCLPPADTTLVEFRSGDNILRGFIDLPQRTGKHPAIMIVHGGADTDVTIDTGYWEEMRKAFRRAGMATLIWDKAGNGCSSGKYSNGLPIRERATETLAALEALKQRDDIDVSRIGVWALSQGGWIAPMAAVRSKNIAYLIVVSGPGRDALSQGAYPSIHMLRDAGVGAAEAENAYATLRRGIAVLRAGGTPQDSSAVVAPLQKYPVLRRAYGLDTRSAEYLQTLLAAPEWWISADVFLWELNQPTLAIFGERDTVVDWRESIDVYRTSFARAGNRDLTIRTFKEADHDMFPPAAKRSQDSLFVDGYIDAMITWLAARNFTGVQQ